MKSRPTDPKAPGAKAPESPAGKAAEKPAGESRSRLGANGLEPGGRLELFAHELADASREILSRGLPRKSFETKDDNSPVTEADKAVEAALRAMIRERYPEHGFFGEETAADRLDAELVWVVDPIDGTKAFLTGMPVYSTLISLTRLGEPVFGLMDFPALGERFFGGAGRGAARSSGAIRSRKCPGKPIMAITNPEALTLEERARARQLRSIASFAVYGGSSLAYARLASGRIDLCVDAGLDPYDYCPLAPVVAGAGGMMTDWEGRPLTLGSGRRVVASGDPALHERVLGILQSPLPPLSDGPPW